MYCVRHFEGERTSTKIKYLHCPRLAESVLVAETAIRSNRLNRPQSLRMACTNPDRPPPSPHHHLLPNSIGIVPLTASRANIAVALSPFLIIHRHRVAIMPSLSVDLSSCRPSPSSCHHTAHRCPSPLRSWSIAVTLTLFLAVHPRRVTVKQSLLAVHCRRVHRHW
jgi:hypothetical protein